MNIRQGRVVFTATNPDGKGIPSAEASSLTLSVRFGIDQDRHVGTRKAGVRERELFDIEKGADVLNWREVSLVSVEDLDMIRRNLGLPGTIPFGSLAENVAIEGIEHFSLIPSGSVLAFGDEQRPSTAKVWVMATNMPCGVPGAIMQPYFPNDPELAKRFKHAADGIRGLVGMVLQGGEVAPGMRVSVLPPRQLLKELEKASR